MAHTQPDLGDRYRLEAVLRSGVVATVYRALDTANARPVAVKVLAAGAGGRDSGQRERFLHDARTVQSLGVKCFPPLIDHGVLADGTGFLVMDLVQGIGFGTLAGSAPSQVLPLVGQVAQSLEPLAQAGVFHHNLCPENLMVAAAAVGVRAQVLGFGTAALRDSGGRLHPGSRSVESLAFAAPELLAPPEAGVAAEGGADLYSLARVVCLLLEARVTPAGGGAKQVRLPERVQAELESFAELEAVLSRSVHADPRQRRASLGELASVLLQATHRPRPGAGGGTERTARIPLPAAPGEEAPVPAGDFARTVILSPPPPPPPPAAGRGEVVEPAPPPPPPPASTPDLSAPPVLERTVTVPIPVPPPPPLEVGRPRDEAPEREFELDTATAPDQDEAPGVVVSAPDLELDTELFHAADVAPPVLAASQASPDAPPAATLEQEEPTPPPAEDGPGGAATVAVAAPVLPPPSSDAGPAVERTSGGVAVPKLKVKLGSRPPAPPPPGPAVQPGPSSGPPPSSPVLEPREVFDPNKTNPAMVRQALGPEPLTPAPSAYAPAPPPPPPDQTAPVTASAPPPPPEVPSGEAVVAPLPPRPAAGSLPRWLWPVVGGALVLVVTLAVVVLTSRPRVQTPPPVITLTPPVAEVPAPEVLVREPDSRLHEVEVLLAEGNIARAREVMAAIAAPEVIAFSPEERATYHALLEELEGLGRQSAVEQLRSGMGSGNIGQIRRSVNALADLSREELAAEGADVPQLLGQARRALQLNTRLVEAARTEDHAAVLERSAEVLAVLPGNSNAREVRERAARALEERSRGEAQAGRYESAAEFLRVLQRRWPEREGLEAAISRLMEQHAAVERGRSRLETALATLDQDRPDEGLRLLGGDPTHPSLAQEYREARERLQGRLAQLDARSPEISLVGEGDLRYRKDEAASIRLRVVDDFRVEGVRALVRGEGSQQFREIQVRPAGGDSYVLEVVPQVHGNQTVQFYVEARDPSGHVSRLGSAEAPLELRRRGLFRR